MNMDNTIASKKSVSSVCVKVEIGAHFSRSITDDGWQTIDASHIGAWKAASEILSERTIGFDGDKIRLKVNWGQIVSRLERHYEIMKKIYFSNNIKDREAAVEEFDGSRFELDFSLEIYDKNEASRKNIALYVVECFLHDVFVIMNLASPSSLSLYSAKLLGQKNEDNLRLSNGLFEIAIVDSVDGKWPIVGFIDVNKVSDWYWKIRPEMKMLPKNRMEKVVFSILHLARSPISAANVIWLFYALEAMFECKVGENFRTLCQRIELLLEPNEKQSKLLRKKLRELYDLRSAFVHGGLEVVHPMDNEILDKSVLESHSKIMNATEYGFQILLASVQKIIGRGWLEPAFEENLVGRFEF